MSEPTKEAVEAAIKIRARRIPPCYCDMDQIAIAKVIDEATSLPELLAVRDVAETARDVLLPDPLRSAPKHFKEEEKAAWHALDKALAVARGEE